MARYRFFCCNLKAAASCCVFLQVFTLRLLVVFCTNARAMQYWKVLGVQLRSWHTPFTM